MLKNKIITYLLTIAIAFTTVFSFQESYAISKEEIDAIFPRTNNMFELTITEIMLTVGDFVNEYLAFLLKEEVTVGKIIFNKVDMLNANFFDNTTNHSRAQSTPVLKEAINKWYEVLGNIVLIIYMIALVVVGIVIMLGTAGSKAKAQDTLVKWTLGIAIFFFFPYVMKYAFELNEAIITAIYGIYSKGNPYITSYVGAVSDLKYDEQEFRSPKYVKRSSYVLELGSEDATTAYINSLETYEENGDMMRIMRSLAGITARTIYGILWWIMFYQTLIFVWIYLKRYLMIAFLIMIFPITLIEFIIGTLSTGKQSGLSQWSKEFFTNVFLQSIHAIVYGIIAGIIMNQIFNQLSSGGLVEINWLLMICSVNFIFEGEKILKEIMNAGHTETIKNAADVAQGASGQMKKMGGNVKKAFSK